MSHPARGPIGTMGIDGKTNAADGRRHCIGRREAGAEAVA
jgi:hypothetical protein